MSNEYPGDEPTRVHRPFEENEPTQVEPRRYQDEDNATRLEQSIPAYDPTREPARNPYPVTEKTEPGIAAQLVAVGLICLLIGLGLGYFLFRGLDSDGSGEDESTTTTELTTTTTESTTTTTEAATSTTSRAAVSTTTARPATSTTAPRPATTARPATTTTLLVTTSTAAASE